MTVNHHATLGASSLATILGVPGPTGKFWRSPLSIWAEIKGLAEGQSDNDAIKTGRMFEAAICQRYAEDMNVSIRPGPLYEEEPVIGPEPWMSCRPDRYVHDGSAPPLVPQDPHCSWLLEAKKTRSFHKGADATDTWGPTDTERVPMAYFLQVHWQMLICRHHDPEIRRCDLAAFSPNAEEFRVYSILADEDFERSIMDRARAWWTEYVLGGKQPPVTDGSEATKKTLVRLTVAGVTPDLREPDLTDLALARDLLRLKREAAELEARLGGIEAQIMERIGEATGIKGIATWSPVKGRKTLDSKGIEKAHPDIYAAFLKEGAPTRRFNFNFSEDE